MMHRPGLCSIIFLSALAVAGLIVPVTTTAARLQEEADNAGSELTVMDGGAEGVTIVYMPNVVQTQYRYGGAVFTDFFVEKGTYNGNPGEPRIPLRNVLIALPENAVPTIEVVESEYRTHSGVTAVNAPGTAPSDSVFTANTWLPAREPAAVEKPRYLRMQRVLPLTLSPVMYNPYLHQARIATRIVLRVRFNAPPGGQPSTAGVADTAFEPYYRNVLINYDSGRMWRRKPPVKPAGRRGQFGGLWFTIPVAQEGIYRITYDDLVNSSLTPGDIDPRTIQIFNNGGRMLPESLDAPRPEGLVENAVRVVGEEDGSFDPGDYVIFYGRGTNGWEWDTNRREIGHYQSLYSRENRYWFTFGRENGKRMTTAPFIPGGTGSVESSRALVYREDEREKLHENSGSDWYMDILLSGDTDQFSVDLPGYRPGTDARFRILVATAGLSSYQLSSRVNGEEADVTSFFGFNERLIRFSNPVPDEGTLNLSIANTSSSGLNQIFLDWYEVEYEKTLSAEDGILKFQAPDSTGVVQFRLGGFSAAGVDIYDITAYDDVGLHESTFEQASSSFLFTDDLSGGARQYLVVERDRYLPVPALVPQPAITDLRISNISADMIIVTPREFTGAAQQLKEFRESRDGLRTEVVTVEDIYDNFSGGLLDPVAIRDFVKFAFDFWTDEAENPPRYLLLFGDGHYDYLGIRSSVPNRVPPFQVNSIFDLTTRVVDDFYGYVSGNDRFLDLAVGRLPVQSAAMARDVVAKIIAYQSNPFFGPWRNRIGFAADDEVTPSSLIERLHTDQMELIAGSPSVPSHLNQRKIYLMEYPAVQDVTSSGVRKPGAEDDMVALMNEGVLILNYVGHGNERVLAHEWLLNREIDMPRIDNGRKQFFFYLSSCTFGRWDIPGEESMGELLVTAPDRGAIGLISAARDVFAGPNHALMDAFYTHFFNGTRKTEPFGLALMQAKIENRSINSEKYHLLGDPSMSLDLPGEIVQIDTVEPDSLKALATVRVDAAIARPAPFAGTAFLSVFDSEKDGEHIMANGSPVTYKLPGSSIFRGGSQVSAGSGGFRMSFVVPKDITYGGTNGRISMYVWNKDEDGAVSLSGLAVGGTATGVVDDSGPDIEVFFDGRRFVSGDIVSPLSELRLRISDPHGINITGEVGHKIELLLDDDASVVDLSPLFEYESGSYTSGELRYTVSGLSPGDHTLTVRAWDNFNNSSIFTGILSVVAESDLVVRDVYNYPNPFSEETQFTCQLNAPADIDIKIYTVAGRLIKKLHYFHSGASSFFVSPPWDGRDEDGDTIANGTYFYKLIAKSGTDGTRKQVEQLSKLVIMR